MKITAMSLIKTISKCIGIKDKKSSLLYKKTKLVNGDKNNIVLPYKKYMRASSESVLFLPFSENLLRGPSLSLVVLQAIIQDNIREFIIDSLMTVSGYKLMEPAETPDINQALLVKNISELNTKDIKSIQGILSSVAEDNTKYHIIDVRLGRSESLMDDDTKRYPVTLKCMSPLLIHLTEKLNAKGSVKVMGKPVTKKVLKSMIGLINDVVPGLNDGKYDIGSDERVGPSAKALMETWLAFGIITESVFRTMESDKSIEDRLNKVVKVFRHDKFDFHVATIPGHENESVVSLDRVLSTYVEPEVKDEHVPMDNTRPDDYVPMDNTRSDDYVPMDNMVTQESHPVNVPPRERMTKPRRRSSISEFIANRTTKPSSSWKDRRSNPNEQYGVLEAIRRNREKRGRNY